MDFLFNNTYLYFFTQSFWRDEAFTVLLSKQPIIDLIVNTARDFNPPLYYVIVHFWIKFFGYSEISVRTISLIFYWLIIYFCYLFLVNIFKFGLKKSFVYLLFFIINPVLFLYGCEARMYTMFAFLATASFYFFLTKQKKLYLITTTLGLFTHYFMIFVLAVQILSVFIKDRKIVFSKYHQLLIPPILFLPWLIFVGSQKNWQLSSFWIEPATLKTVINFPALLFTGYENDQKFLGNLITKIAYFLWLFLSISFIVIKLKRKKIEHYVKVIIIWGLLLPFTIVLVSFFKPIFLVRYLIFSSVGFLLLLTYLWDNLNLFFKLIILAVTILILLNFRKLELKNHKKSNYRSIMTEIKYLAKPGDLMYVTSELDFFTAQYYFDENRVFVYGKSYAEIPDYVGKILIPESRLTNSLPKFPNKAFILTSDTHYEIQSSL